MKTPDYEVYKRDSCGNLGVAKEGKFPEGWYTGVVQENVPTFCSSVCKEVSIKRLSEVMDAWWERVK